MKKKIIILAAVAVSCLIAISCSTSEKNTGSTKTLVLSEKKLPAVETLKLEKLNISEDFLIGSSCFVYRDSILLVLKDGDPYPLTHMLTIFNLNTSNKIGEYFTRGQGPNEMLSAIGYLGGNHLDIRCYATNKLTPFNIDSAIICGNNYKPNIICPSEMILLDCRTLNDTTLLATNMFYFDGSDDFKANANIPEFFTINRLGQFTPEYKNYENLKCLPANVTGCEIAINRNKQRIVCCYHYRPYVKIFDLNMDLIRKVVGPESDDGKYRLEDDNYMLFFDGGVNHYYFQAFNDDNNIFVINNRTHNWVKEFEGEKYTNRENQTTEIFRFDWDGNIVGRYSAKGYEIINVTYSQTSNTMYLWLSDNGEHTLYKAKLN